KQLVLRQPSVEDRRCWYALITEKGSKLAENSLQTVVDQQAKIISKLPDKEIDPMFKALKLYVEKYEEVLKETYVEL
ncbi:MAG TPA: MarR family winged helix-turn-helix transcriptional regulator, partial [Candidatus Cloacimonas sp.]|nr:MarR family winged helix-turn-helix transcriptional regulator [Candidatus Cloacimonas sp.]